MFIYPDNLKAKATLWLWELRDVAIIGVGFLFSVLAIAQTGILLPLVVTVLYAFLSIRLEGSSILDFLRYAVCFLLLKQMLQIGMSEAKTISSEILAQHQQLLSWAELFNSASIDEKKVISSQMIKAVTLTRNYGIQIEFNISEAQFLNGMEMG